MIMDVGQVGKDGAHTTFFPFIHISDFNHRLPNEEKYRSSHNTCFLIYHNIFGKINDRKTKLVNQMSCHQYKMSTFISD